MGAQMATLRAEAPDLANLVVEERMTLREALAPRACWPRSTPRW